MSDNATDDACQRYPQAAYIDPTARVFGSVEIGEGASLWPYSVIRAEGFQVRIGRFTNLQDHVMVHVGYAKPTIVGDYCSVTHRVVLHGCTIGDNCLIGIGATVMEGAVIGENSIVAGHAFVPDNMVVPPNSVVMGMPAKVVRSVNGFVANKVNAMLYWRNARLYAKGDHRAWDGPEFEAEMRRHQQEIERELAAKSRG
jgi:carbonic anhydrase/acetyltransferase-like protein (isoleucine patch superfamily)